MRLWDGRSATHDHRPAIKVYGCFKRIKVPQRINGKLHQSVPSHISDARLKNLCLETEEQ